MVEINYMYIDLVRELVLAKRQIRKLQRKLRKAAGREKRLIREATEKFRYEPRFMWGVNHAQCKCVVENVNI